MRYICIRIKTRTQKLSTHFTQYDLLKYDTNMFQFSKIIKPQRRVLILKCKAFFTNYRKSVLVHSFIKDYFQGFKFNINTGLCWYAIVILAYLFRRYSLYTHICMYIYKFIDIYIYVSRVSNYTGLKFILWDHPYHTTNRTNDSQTMSVLTVFFSCAVHMLCFMTQLAEASPSTRNLDRSHKAAKTSAELQFYNAWTLLVCMTEWCLGPPWATHAPC